MSAELDLLFVYGTLMTRARGSLGADMRARLKDTSVSLGAATMPGRLFGMGTFPVMIAAAAPSDIVHGEVLRLHDPEAAFVWLDPYEGIEPGHRRAGEYERVRRTVLLASGERKHTSIFGGTSDGYLFELRVYGPDRHELHAWGKPFSEPGIYGLVARETQQEGGGATITIDGLAGHPDGITRTFRVIRGPDRFEMIPGGPPIVDGQPCSPLRSLCLLLFIALLFIRGWPSNQLRPAHRQRSSARRRRAGAVSCRESARCRRRRNRESNRR